MAYIAKQNSFIPQTIIAPDRFELFETAIMKNAADEDVEVLKSIGTFSTAELQQRKDYLIAEIAEIEVKLKAIETIKTK
jgi:hypothetical protein